MKEIFFHKRDGAITNPKTVRKLIDSLDDGPYLMKIESKRKRTVQQNAWLHAILPEIAEALREKGYREVKTPDDAKLVIRCLFFKKKITNGIEEIEVVGHTSDETKENFIDKADEIIQWCAEYLGIDVAPPGKQTELQLTKNRYFG